MTAKDEPIEYIKRTRRYYQALGYGKPYEWATFESVPFTVPTLPVSRSKVGIVTTAAPYQEDKGEQGPGAPYNAAAKFFSVYRLPADPSPDLRISHVGIDRDHTTAEDPASYLPLSALKAAWQEGLIATPAESVYGLPTNRSQGHTVTVDSQELLKLVKEDSLDIVIFAPNCPVCHQSVSLAARTLEANGLVTVVLGCAKDIVERVGVPRFVFNDFPLGNAAGIPGDVASQTHTIREALKLAESAEAPRTTVQTHLKWPGPAGWKDDYSNPDKLSDEEIARRRADFDTGKAIAKSKQKSDQNSD